LERPLKKNIIKYLSNLPKDYFDIPLFYINKLEINSTKKSTSKYLLDLHTKDNRHIRLEIFSEDKNLYSQINKFITPKDFSDFLKYGMTYRENHPVNNDGWRIYKMREEFRRQGIIYSVDNFVNEKDKNKSEEVVKIKNLILKNKKLLYFSINFDLLPLTLIMNFVLLILGN
jgi:hypothetical protein